MTNIALALLLSATIPPTPMQLRLKTNAAPWALTVMNISPELTFNSRFSVAVPVLWCPWFLSEKFAVRTLAFQPEGRFWLKKGYKGHFFGVHASLAWYNVRNGNFRYQDSGRPLLGGGVSYGYSLPFAGSWLAEFSIGGGFADLRYDRFHNSPNGPRIDTRHTSYWGLDHISISIGYSFNL